MAAATVWKGQIAFAGIQVPVKLHSTVKDDRIRFHLLHDHDRVRLRQQMFCALEKKPVPPGEQAKGFELEKDKYLILESNELEAAVPEAGREISVHEFVKSSRIDPAVLDRTYYLEPDGAGTGYAELLAALQQRDATGICTWTMRKRSYLGALQARAGLLRLTTLRYADEVIPAASLELPDAAMTERELDIGSQLLEQMTGTFQPEKFGNEHRRKLQAMIEQKARGETITMRPSLQRRPTEPDSLLDALEASLKKTA